MNHQPIGRIFFSGQRPKGMQLLTAKRTYRDDDFCRNGETIPEVLERFFSTHPNWILVKQELDKIGLTLTERLLVISKLTSRSIWLVKETRGVVDVPALEEFSGANHKSQEPPLCLYQIGSRFYVLQEAQPLIISSTFAETLGFDLFSKDCSLMLQTLLKRQKDFATCVCRDNQTRLGVSLPLPPFMVGFYRPNLVVDLMSIFLRRKP